MAILAAVAWTSPSRLALASPARAVVVAVATWVVVGLVGRTAGLRWALWSVGSLLGAIWACGLDVPGGIAVTGGLQLLAHWVVDTAAHCRSSVPGVADPHASTATPLLFVAAIQPAASWLAAGPAAFVATGMAASLVVIGFREQQRARTIRRVALLAVLVAATSIGAASIERPPVFAASAAIVFLAGTGGRDRSGWRMPGESVAVTLAVGSALTWWCVQVGTATAGAMLTGSTGHPGWKAMLSTRPDAFVWALAVSGVVCNIAALLAIGAEIAVGERRVIARVTPIAVGALLASAAIGLLWQVGGVIDERAPAAGRIQQSLGGSWMRSDGGRWL
ncbi:MAG TPA: hypothetical protein PKD80_07795 [Microthrixaceae bacterium]|nr:hypothetical protein [Microthrixaceae bacterium]